MNLNLNKEKAVAFAEIWIEEDSEENVHISVSGEDRMLTNMLVTALAEQLHVAFGAFLDPEEVAGAIYNDLLAELINLKEMENCE